MSGRVGGGGEVGEGMGGTTRNQTNRLSLPIYDHFSC